MKFNRNLGFLVLALALGMVAAWMAVRYINREVAVRTRRAMPSATAMQRLVVPQHPLLRGTTLHRDDLAARSVPADFVPADALTPDDYRKYLGSVLRAPLAQGAPIPASALVRSVDRFSELIRPGHVAYTLPVSESNAISGLIVPGDHVDLLLVVGGRWGEIRPFLGDVKVLATGHDIEGEAGAQQGGQTASAYSDITLEVTPLQAQRLGLVRKVGQLRVLLRRPGSLRALALNRLSAAELLRVGGPDRSGIQFIIGGVQ